MVSQRTSWEETRLVSSHAYHERTQNITHKKGRCVLAIGACSARLEKGLQWSSGESWSAQSSWGVSGTESGAAVAGVLVLSSFRSDTDPSK